MKSKVHWNGGTACGGNKVSGFFYILLWSSLFVACQLSTEYWCGVHDLLNIFAVFLQCLSRQCRCGVAVVPPVYHLPGYACRNPGTDREGLCDSDRLAPDFSDDFGFNFNLSPLVAMIDQVKITVYKLHIATWLQFTPANCQHFELTLFPLFKHQGKCRTSVLNQGSPIFNKKS